VVGAFVLHKRHCLSFDIYSSTGILYSSCSVLAYREIYHSRGMPFIATGNYVKHVQYEHKLLSLCIRFIY
jgi:hypothetical protein